MATPSTPPAAMQGESTDVTAKEGASEAATADGEQMDEGRSNLAAVELCARARLLLALAALADAKAQVGGVQQAFAAVA